MGRAVGVRQLPSRACGCERCLAAEPLPARPPTKRCTAAWQFRWYDAAGQRHSGTRPTRAEALAAKAEAETNSRAGTYLDPKRGRVTVASWREQWLTGRDVERATTARDTSHWNAHVGPRWGNTPLSAISHQDVQTWVTGLTRKGLAAATVRSILNSLDMLLAAALRDRRIPYNPADGVTTGRPQRRHPDDERPPTREQVEAVCSVIAYGPYRRLPLFILETGLRWEEAVGLLWDCIDRENRVMYVRRVVEEVRGRKVLREYPKSDAGNRALPLTRRALALLDGQEADQPPEDGRPVFRGRHGALLGRDNFRTRVWLPATKDSGVHREKPRPSGTLEHWPTIHDIRHSWATMLENAGVSRATLKELLGHARPQSDVTWRYTHGAADVRELVLRALGDIPAQRERPVRKLRKVRRLIPNPSPSEMGSSGEQWARSASPPNRAARQ